MQTHRIFAYLLGPGSYWGNYSCFSLLGIEYFELSMGIFMWEVAILT